MSSEESVARPLALVSVAVLAIANLLTPTSSWVLHVLPSLSAAVAATIVIVSAFKHKPAKRIYWYFLALTFILVSTSTAITGLHHSTAEGTGLMIFAALTFLTMVCASTFFIGIAYSVVASHRGAMFLDALIGFTASTAITYELATNHALENGYPATVAYIDLVVLGICVGLFGLIIRLLSSSCRSNIALRRIAIGLALCAASQGIGLGTTLPLSFTGTVLMGGMLYGAMGASHPSMKTLTKTSTSTDDSLSPLNMIFFELVFAMGPVVSFVGHTRGTLIHDQFRWAIEQTVITTLIIIRVTNIWMSAKRINSDLQEELATRRSLENTVERHLAQQQAISELSQYAISDLRSGVLVTRATKFCCELLGAKLSFLAETQPGNNTIRIFQSSDDQNDRLPDSVDDDYSFLVSGLESVNPCVLMIDNPEFKSELEQLLLMRNLNHVAIAQIIAGDGAPIGLLVALWPDSESIPTDALSFLSAVAQVFTVITERDRAEEIRRQGQRLESVGRLAAGIAHEINTPSQFIGDNLRFLQSTFEVINGLLPDSERTKFLRSEIPLALQQSLDGMQHISNIVGAMKSFGFSDQNHPSYSDLNAAISNAITVSRNEWKYVAEVNTDFATLPLIECYIAELNQVFLNLIVNSAHAMESKYSDGETKGEIKISTEIIGRNLLIKFNDTGSGIPTEIQHRIFEPFFTTKELGKGTGQGLALVEAVMRKHKGILRFETSSEGTTFFLSLPIKEITSEPHIAQNSHA